MNFLGRFSLGVIPYNKPLVISAFGVMVFLFLLVLLIITILRKWHYIWHEWMTSTDHKKIGIMYVTIGIIMGLRGFADAIMIRSHLALAYGPSHGYLEPNHFNQVFSSHGVIMIFLTAMPLIIGLINFAVPLQIGARDVAFPFLNSISLWLLIAAAVLMNISLGIGEFAKTGWIAYPPLSERTGSPWVGVDYYIWVLQIAGISSLLTGINFITTILKCRAPGMTLMKMPLFTWCTLASMLLVVGAFPVLTVDLSLLALDRYLGMHFFTNENGGNLMLYVNWFWAWGHPEVYILILPVFGIFSEVLTTFSGRYIFGYSSMVYSIAAITVISYLVWLHHFFVMGAGATVNAIFGISTMIIAVPTGVKVFNWLFTIYHGRLRITTPVLWTLGFLATFVIGGMTGVMLSIPPADFVLHNSQFLIAHFHNTLVGGTIFGTIAGIIYWFPKAFGYKLNETFGKIGFLFFTLGFYTVFFPLYALGLMGMTRRINHFDNESWRMPMIIAAIGIGFFAIGIFFILLQFLTGFFFRHPQDAVANDPWDGRTLEWSVPSPPPRYNFATVPTIISIDDFWRRKQGGEVEQVNNVEPILLLRNTPASFFIGMLTILIGFGLTWYIWWMVAMGIIGILLVLFLRGTQTHLYEIISPEEIRGRENYV